MLIGAPQHRFQGIFPLLRFQRRHVSPAYRPQFSTGDHQFAHRPAIGQQAVQIPAQKAFDSHLSPAAGHHLQKNIEPVLCLTVPAPDLKPAAQPYHFRDRGIQHRNGFPHLPVNPLLPGAQRRKPLHHPKGVGVPGAKLAYCRNASGFLLLSFQKIAPFKQILP